MGNSSFGKYKIVKDGVIYEERDGETTDEFIRRVNPKQKRKQSLPKIDLALPACGNTIIEGYPVYFRNLSDPLFWKRYMTYHGLESGDLRPEYAQLDKEICEKYRATIEDSQKNPHKYVYGTLKLRPAH